MAMMTNGMDTFVWSEGWKDDDCIEIVLGQCRLDQVVDCILYGLYSLLLYGYNLDSVLFGLSILVDVYRLACRSRRVLTINSFPLFFSSFPLSISCFFYPIKYTL